MILIPVTKAAASTAPFTRIGLPVRPGLARGVETRNQVLAASAWQTGQLRPHRWILENSIDWGNFTAVYNFIWWSSSILWHLMWYFLIANLQVLHLCPSVAWRMIRLLGRMQQQLNMGVAPEHKCLKSWASWWKWVLSPVFRKARVVKILAGRLSTNGRYKGNVGQLIIDPYLNDT